MNWISVKGLQLSIIARAQDTLARYVTRSSSPALIPTEDPELTQALTQWKASSRTAYQADPTGEGLAAHDRYYSALVRDLAHTRTGRNQLRSRGLNQKTYRAFLLAWAGSRTGRSWSGA